MEEASEKEDSSVFMYLIKYNNTYYSADCVEVTPDTAFFQVDPSLVRRGIFPVNRLDFRWFKDMGVLLYTVFHPPLLEQ